MEDQISSSPPISPEPVKVEDQALGDSEEESTEGSGTESVEDSSEYEDDDDEFDDDDIQDTDEEYIEDVDDSCVKEESQANGEEVLQKLRPRKAKGTLERFDKKKPPKCPPSFDKMSALIWKKKIHRQFKAKELMASLTMAHDSLREANREALSLIDNALRYLPNSEGETFLHNVARHLQLARLELKEAGKLSNELI